GRADGAPRAARPAAPGGDAVRARRSAPRGDRGRGTLPVGAPGWCERRGVSGSGGGAGGLVVGAGSRERGAVCSGGVRRAERHATSLALDRKGRAARCRDLVGGRPSATRRYPAV